MRVVGTELVSKVTGHESVNGTAFGVHATDLGVMWSSGERTFVVFGDTYGDGWCGDGAGPSTGADWRCNFLAVAEPQDLSAGLRFTSVVARDDGAARQVLERDPGSEEETVIPCAGIEVDGVHYLHYMSVRNWGVRGKWFTNYAGIAFSVDDGHTWEKPGRSRWVNRAEKDHPFQMGAFARDDSWLYLLGTPNGRWGSASLARVGFSDILEPAAYSYWTGSSWVERDPFRAVPVLSGPVAELSVVHNTHFNRWLALHLDETLSAIVLRTAETLTGPWTLPQVVVAGDRYPGLYGGFLHPDSADGPVLYHAMSQWSPYNVYLMRTELAD
ncbi:Basic proline-rich protein [Actinokineospora spheciospongiae]|uniref:Basic proline-rich protein n=1 Tax=Actinokineospora spheciospongiae TaxID=909613 RepID=W7IQ32_9PSEU|nr:DUF4185 domain-containing protein [Actinokineospora spheciospongiae]EWC58626.1 Basic proline-rich protein [Actinokineospora spheciospongiae]